MEKVPVWIPHHISKRFTTYPLTLRVGPWSPLAYASLISVFLSLVLQLPDAMNTLLTSQKSDYFGQTNDIKILRAICGIWGFFVIGLVIYFKAFWVFISYTFWTWIACTLRLSFAAVASYCENCHWAGTVADVMRFPALAQSIITVVVWWTVVFPIIMCLSSTRKERIDFLKYNCRLSSWKLSASRMRTHTLDNI
jgi:hypothetical protein